MRQRVLLASNRGPFSYWFGAEGTPIGRRGGGLITGMTPGVAAVAAQAEVIWICAAFTDADRAAAHRWGADSRGPRPVLSQRGCALVLSHEAGAAATHGDHALLVNPYDVSETAAALAKSCGPLAT